MINSNKVACYINVTVIIRFLKANLATTNILLRTYIHNIKLTNPEVICENCLPYQVEE